MCLINTKIFITKAKEKYDLRDIIHHFQQQLASKSFLNWNQKITFSSSSNKFLYSIEK